MKVGYTFVTIGSPTFRKSFFRPNLFFFSAESSIFRPKTLSAEPLNVKSNDTLTMPSIFVSNFSRRIFFHPVTSFRPKDIPAEIMFRPNYLSAEKFFRPNIISAEICFGRTNVYKLPAHRSCHSFCEFRECLLLCCSEGVCCCVVRRVFVAVLFGECLLLCCSESVCCCVVVVLFRECLLCVVWRVFVEFGECLLCVFGECLCCVVCCVAWRLLRADGRWTLEQRRCCGSWSSERH
jgi:hypothetical protein